MNYSYFDTNYLFNSAKQTAQEFTQAVTNLSKSMSGYGFYNKTHPSKYCSHNKLKYNI